MKTKKLSKQILSLFVLAVISFCLAFAVMPSNLVRASEQSSTPTYSTFTAIDGASVRMGMGTDEDPFGIRFTTTISATDYQSIIEAYPGQEVTFGTIIGRNVTDMDDFKANGTKVESSVWDEKYNPGKASNEYRYNLVIMNLQDENLNTPYTALGYYAVDSEVKGYAENAVTRTPLQVLTVEMTNTAEDLEDVENLEKNQENLLAMIDTAMASAEFKFTNSELTVGCYQEVTPELTVNGAKVTPILTVEDNGVAEVTANGTIKGLKGGSVTVTATILSATGSNYTATATVEVTKGEVKPVVNADGTLALNTNGEETTVSVNGTAVDGTYSADTLNIVDYILDNNTITAETDFTISVSSAGLEGSVTHKFIPVNNSNFKTQLKTANADNKSTRHYFLTENITLETAHFDSTWAGYRSALGSIHAHLDGRGYTIAYDINTDSWTSNTIFAGISRFPDMTWQNIYFDMDLTYTNGNIQSLFSQGYKNSEEYPNNGILNCWFDISLNPVDKLGTGKNLDAQIFACSAGRYENNVFDIKVAGKNTAYVASAAGALPKPNFENNIVITNIDNYQFTTTANQAKTIEHNYLYSDMKTMLNGGNHKTMGNTVFSDYKTVDTTDAPVYNYSTFDTNVWSFDKENGIIKLCGREVYNKTLALAIGEDGILTFDTKGESAKVYATVAGQEETLVTESALKSYDIGAYASAQGWATEQGTVVTIRVESTNYSGSTTHTFKKLNANAQVDIDGIVTFDTKGETATVYVDNVAVDGAENGFDLTAYAFANGLNTDKTYTVKVESSSYAGETTKTYKALNNENFKSTISSATAEDIGIYHFLTEDIALTTANDATVEKTEGSYSGKFVFDTDFATLDGRGYEISWAFSMGAWSIGGISYNHCGYWKNIAFNVSGSNGNFNTSVFIYKMQKDSDLSGSLINCYIKATLTGHAGGTYLFGDKVNDGTIKNCVFDISCPQDVTIIKRMFNPSTVIDSVLITSGSVTTVTRSDQAPVTFDAYANHSDFANGINGTKYSCGSGHIGALTGVANGTTESPVKVYTNWDSVWNISASGITLCGQAVYTPAQ